MADMSGSASTVSLLAGTGLLSVQYALMRAGLRTRADGWRRAACVVLRGEASTFALSAFGLNALAGNTNTGTTIAVPEMQARIERGLTAFLLTQPSCTIRIRRSRHEDHLEQTAAPSYALAFEPWNGGPARFAVPIQWPSVNATSRGPAEADVVPLLRFVCRVSESGECDVWMRCNHAGIDGVAAQEILTGLEAAWGSKGKVLFPTPEAFEPFETPRECTGRAGLAEVQAFVDFSQLLAWRKAQNARLPEPMTLAAAILWRLSRHARFVGTQMGTTVEVAATHGLARGVGVVVVQPGKSAADDGLAAYVRDFNQQMECTRRRESAGCRTLDAAARIHPKLAGDLLRHTLRMKPQAFGTLALTMLKDARVFGAPIAETGHEAGFLAIGDVGLPCADGGRVGCVCIKGPRETIASYPKLLREILAN